jgi:hypothetical protein
MYDAELAPSVTKRRMKLMPCSDPIDRSAMLASPSRASLGGNGSTRT